MWLPSVAQPDDRVVIYFAGHGFVKDGRAYLAPYDLNPDNIPGTGYPMDTLGNVAGSRIRAKWKVLLTDSCHSGAITRTPTPSSTTRACWIYRVPMFSLTASRDRERSFESASWGGGHGIFTYYVVKGGIWKAEADENRDGIVSTRRRTGPTTFPTATCAKKYHKRQQNPTSDRRQLRS